MSVIEKEVITEIASQLAVPTEYVFMVITEAQPIVGILNLVLIGLALLITSVLTWKATMLARKKEQFENEWIFIASVVFVTVGGLSIILMLLLSGNILKILLPEYSAIMKIAEMIG